MYQPLGLVHITSQPGDFFTVVSVPLHYIVSGVKLRLNTFVFGGFTRKDDIFGGFSFVLNIQWEVPWM